MRRTLIALFLAGYCCVPATLLARTWTDDTGKFSVEADFVRVVGDAVELKRADGKILSVPLARLSAADQNYVRDLQTKAAEPPSPRPSPEPRPRPQPRPAAARDASQALKQGVNADFDAVPLRDALRSLAEQSGANIVLDAQSLADAGMDPNRPVSARLAGTLDAALDAMLKDAGLAHLVRHDVVFVTAEAVAERYPQARVYKLKRVAPLDALVADIQKNVAPESWEEAGGIGSISPLVVGAVVISQSAPLHREIEKRYDKLLLPGGPPSGGWGKPVSVEFIETPLTDALTFLGDLLKVKVRIDKPALDEVGIGGDTPVTLKLTNVPAGSVLSLLTEPLGLDWTREKDAIAITTPERLEARTFVVNYDVRGLTVLPDGSDLIAAIVNTVAPASWEELGGAGTIGLAAPGQLAVRQSDNVHRGVEMMLAALRGR